MNPNNYMAHLGATLVDRGYAILPIQPSTKKPGMFRLGAWQDYTHPKILARAKRLPWRWSERDIGIYIERRIIERGFSRLVWNKEKTKRFKTTKRSLG